MGILRICCCHHAVVVAVSSRQAVTSSSDRCCSVRILHFCLSKMWHQVSEQGFDPAAYPSTSNYVRL